VIGPGVGHSWPYPIVAHADRPVRPVRRGRLGIFSAFRLLWIDLSGQVVAVPLVPEISIVLISDHVIVANPAGGSVTFSVLSSPAARPDGWLDAGAGHRRLRRFQGHRGVHRGGARPRKTIARAIHRLVLPVGLLCSVSAWDYVVTHRSRHDRATAVACQTDLVFLQVAKHLATLLADAGYVRFLTRVFAALLAFHAAVALYQFALGREGRAAGRLGRAHTHTAALPLDFAFDGCGTPRQQLIVYAAEPGTPSAWPC
jgi:hypothetical protein